MQDLIAKILPFFTQYLLDFGNLFSGPKRFIAARNTNIKDNFQPALIFGAISAAVWVILYLPLQPPGTDIWTFLVKLCFVDLFAVVLSAAALRLAWRLVGGKAPFGGFFITFAYYFSVILMIEAAFSLLGFGFFRAMAPALYTQIHQAIIKGQPLPDVSRNKIVMIGNLVHDAGIIAAGIWSFIGWGAYRQLNGLSKMRSAFAIVIWWGLGLGVCVLVYFIAVAMRPA